MIFNARLATVGALLNQKRLTADADEARVCFHDLVETPTSADRAAFKLMPTQTVYDNLMDMHVVNNEGQAEIDQRQAGSSIPPAAWESKYTRILWALKWVKKKGLQPTRPQVCWCHDDITIEPGKAVQFVPGPAWSLARQARAFRFFGINGACSFWDVGPEGEGPC